MASVDDVGIIFISVGTACVFLTTVLIVVQCTCCGCRSKHRKGEDANGKKKTATETQSVEHVDATDEVARVKREGKHKQKSEDPPVKHIRKETIVEVPSMKGDGMNGVNLKKSEAGFNVLPRNMMKAVAAAPPASVERNGRLRTLPDEQMNLPAFTIQVASTCDTVRDLRDRQTFEPTKRGIIRPTPVEGHKATSGIKSPAKESSPDDTGVPAEFYYKAMRDMRSRVVAHDPPKWSDKLGHTPHPQSPKWSDKPPHPKAPRSSDSFPHKDHIVRRPYHHADEPHAPGTQKVKTVGGHSRGGPGLHGGHDGRGHGEVNRHATESRSFLL